MAHLKEDDEVKIITFSVDPLTGKTVHAIFGLDEIELSKVEDVTWLHGRNRE